MAFQEYHIISNRGINQITIFSGVTHLVLNPFYSTDECHLLQISSIMIKYDCENVQSVLRLKLVKRKPRGLFVISSLAMVSSSYSKFYAMYYRVVVNDDITRRQEHIRCYSRNTREE